jgi:hypothetical protein
VRAVIVTALALAACGKSDSKKTKPAGSGSAGSAATAPAAKPVDCATVLTVADIATACELDPVVIILEPPDEPDPSIACQYQIRTNSRIAMRFALDTSPATPAAAKAKLAPAGDDVAPIQVGDAGQMVTSEGMAWQNHDLELVKGKVFVSLKMVVSEKTGAPCSDDGVVAIGKAVAARL